MGTFNYKGRSVNLLQRESVKQRKRKLRIFKRTVDREQQALRNLPEKREPHVAVHPLTPDLSASVGKLPMFAVVELGGKQHKVLEDDLVMTDSLERTPGLEVGEQFYLDRVLMVGSRDFSVFGRPYVGTARVRATVEEHLRLGKILTFRKRRRKASSARLRTIRAPVSMVRIEAIEYEDEPAVLARVAEAAESEGRLPAGDLGDDAVEQLVAKAQ